MKARIPKHREFIINFPDSIDNAKANEGWAKLLHRGLRARGQEAAGRVRLRVHRRVRSVSSEFSVYCIKKSRAFQPAGWNALLFLLLISVPY